MTMKKARIVPGSSLGSQLGIFTREASEAGMTHGQVARVRVHEVRGTVAEGERRPTAFFCTSRVEIIETLVPGDGTPMSEDDMIVESIGRLPEGYSNIEGIISTNGRNTFRRTRDGERSRVAELMNV
jgi:hypothetical protein